MPEMEIKRVSQWIKFIEENNAKYRRNQHFYYRGESDTEYILLPSLYRRINSTSKTEKYLSKSSETKILNDFMTEAAGLISNLSMDDLFRWVQYAQHFGIPTRIMDWTTNPLVALFFACSSNYDKEGRVYILNSLGYRLLTGENDRNNMNGKILKEEAVKMIRDKENAFPYPVLFRPYYLDRRMLSQSSQFMVWGYNKKVLNEMIDELEHDGKKKAVMKYLDVNGVEVQNEEEISILTEAYVSKGNKSKIQRELDGLGINQAMLFPGLDGIGRTVEWRNNIINLE